MIKTKPETIIETLSPDDLTQEIVEQYTAVLRVLVPAAKTPSLDEARGNYRRYVDEEHGEHLVAYRRNLSGQGERMIVGIVSSYDRISGNGGVWARLCTLAVLPQHQRTGVGSRLVEEVIRRAQARGCSWVDLTCHPSKRPFYERFGFKSWSAERMAIELERERVEVWSSNVTSSTRSRPSSITTA